VVDAYGLDELTSHLKKKGWIVKDKTQKESIIFDFKIKFGYGAKEMHGLSRLQIINHFHGV